MISLKRVFASAVSNALTVKVADTLEEACKLVEAGFECATEVNGAKSFRKRK